jgi:hypothetical protein
MNVLFQLLAEAQRPVNTTQIKFASYAVLLRRLGLPVRNRGRARVEDSLLYWACVSIRWSRWYQDRHHVRLLLPPPIEDAERSGNRVIITLDPDWHRLARAGGYYGWLPLPLPPRAAAQNLVLLILTQDLSRSAESNDELWISLDLYFDQLAPLTKAMDRWWLTRKLGLLHKQRNNVLNRAIDQAAGWFAAHGGKLKQVAASDVDEDASPEQIAFRYARPRVHRKKSFMGRSRGPQLAPGRESAWDPNEACTPGEAEWFAELEKEAARAGGRK